MKIALCQINPIIGKLNYNKEKILNGYKQGIKANADLVICPELALVGYPPRDLVEKEEFRIAVNEKINDIAAQTTDVGLIFGAITEDDDLIGTNIHNSAILCYDGKVQFIQPKSLIPNYDVFDEMRYYEPAKEVNVYKFKDETLGISVCEDIWNDADYWYRRRYNIDPVKEQIDKGASVLINISASPYSYGKRQERKEMLSLLCKKDSIPLAYVCCVGSQTDLIFDGASMCLNKKGELTKIGKAYQEDFILFDTNTPGKTIPSKIEKSFEEEVLSCLIYGVKEYCQKLNFNKALVGLSGGIDSAIVTYVAVKALGSENVHVVLMPSKYSSEGSITDSEKLINNLGISSNNVSIQPVVDETMDSLKPSFNEFKKITEENIQARVRGLFLMAFSNNNNYLLLTTGNKSEMAVGYCTLYGDMSGGLAVLADVYKSDIYKIANYINKDEEIIPKEIINKPPSAELSPNQKDQDVLPPYELLDKILKMYLEQNMEIKQISNLIEDEEVVNKVLRLVDINEFKRNQAAPALRVSRKAFGYGRRFPIVQGWRN